MEGANLRSTGYRRLYRACAILFACALSAAFLGSPAAAQSQRSMDVRTAIFGQLSLTNVEDLDFGNVVENGAGTIVMSPDPNATCTASANIIHSGACQPAIFGGSGETGRIVRIKKPPGAKITLTGPGADIQITNVTIDGSPELLLVNATPGYSRYTIASPSGVFSFRVAGTLNIAAGQAPGVYTGTFEISLQYN